MCEYTVQKQIGLGKGLIYVGLTKDRQIFMEMKWKDSMRIDRTSQHQSSHLFVTKSIDFTECIPCAEHQLIIKLIQLSSTIDQFVTWTLRFEEVR